MAFDEGMRPWGCSSRNVQPFRSRVIPVTELACSSLFCTDLDGLKSFNRMSWS